MKTPPDQEPAGVQLPPAANGAVAPQAPVNGEGVPAPLPPEPPLSARAWLSQNGPFVIVCLALLVFAYRQFGGDALWMVAKAVLGIGFVIFIHELGHFLAAKWCDVHVLTFSIGFGPSLPGCNFTRGETTYKIGLLPLGGYVNMVGEGPEADEDEDYPRSFKNKTVGQRMLIICAGVIMNVLFGFLCYAAVYRLKGVEQSLAVVWRTEPGSPAWIDGVRPGWKVTYLDGKKNPFFEDLKASVALFHGQGPLPFEFTDQGGVVHKVPIRPLRDENNLMPTIGVSPAVRLQLVPARYRRLLGTPVLASSAAAQARAFPLGKGDVVLRAAGKDGKVTDLPQGEGGWKELCRRMSERGEEPLTVVVRRAGGKEETLEVPAAGFEFGDAIVGTTDPGAAADRPFDTSPLRPQPPPAFDNGCENAFEYRRRMVRLAGRPIVIQVRRHGAPDEAEPVNLLVPPAYHVTLGARMKMGKVAAVRAGSPAEQAELRPDDTITGVELQQGSKPPVALTDRALDPVRLPWELAERIEHAPAGAKPEDWSVILTVERLEGHNARKVRKLAPMRWDPSFALEEEEPLRPWSPMSIPQLGVAYWVESIVVEVEPGSPAARAGLKKEDVIQKISFRDRGQDGKMSWPLAREIASKRNGEPVYDQWAYVFNRLQQEDYPVVQLTVKRPKNDKPLLLPEGEAAEEGIRAEPDESWPAADRGLRLFLPVTRRQKASSLVEAMGLGLERAVTDIQRIYLHLRSMSRGDVSPKTVGGPIEIATQAYSFAGEDLPTFALFLAMISINLAVVNFLPIPVLDGGHMVFLVYEKLRGRPPSESVRVIATYIGLALILLLMVWVFWQDIERHIVPLFQRVFQKFW